VSALRPPSSGCITRTTADLSSTLILRTGRYYTDSRRVSASSPTTPTSARAIAATRVSRGSRRRLITSQQITWGGSPWGVAQLTKDSLLDGLGTQNESSNQIQQPIFHSRHCLDEIYRPFIIIILFLWRSCCTIPAPDSEEAGSVICTTSFRVLR